MTMSVNIAHRGPDSYVSIVTVEDRVFDHGAQKYTDEWVLADKFTLNAGQHRDVTIHSTRRVMVVEGAQEA